MEINKRPKQLMIEKAIEAGFILQQRMTVKHLGSNCIVTGVFNKYKTPVGKPNNLEIKSGSLTMEIIKNGEIKCIILEKFPYHDNK